MDVCVPFIGVEVSGKSLTILFCWDVLKHAIGLDRIKWF